jgi:tyrosyl-tRNA synthetase
MRKPMKEMSLDEQLEYLKKGAVEIIQLEELRERLRQSIKSKKPLKIKVGFDPTAPDIHLGHTVILRKMKHFQDLGHDVIFLIGDFTGLIGDPSGRSKIRKPLTRKEIQKNAETYKQQFSKILDPERTIVDFNSRWLGELGSEGFIKLASKYTVARILERDDFTNRIAANQPIAVHEILYPLAQAYDSVFLKCDVEMGGTDQKFNLLVGRDIQREYGLPPQIVLTMPLLEGTDGVEKMSKSLDNYIGIKEPADEIFGKIMSISDSLMWRYYELLTDIPQKEIEKMKEQVGSDRANPRDLKMRLAKMIIIDFHDRKAAEEAEEEFKRVFSKGELPEEMQEKRLKCLPEPQWLPKLLVSLNLASSNSQARRLIEQGGVYLNGERIEDTNFELDLSKPEEIIIKVGKRKFCRLIIEQ